MDILRVDPNIKRQGPVVLIHGWDFLFYLETAQRLVYEALEADTAMSGKLEQKRRDDSCGLHTGHQTEAGRTESAHENGIQLGKTVPTKGTWQGTYDGMEIGFHKLFVEVAGGRCRQTGSALDVDTTNDDVSLHLVEVHGIDQVEVVEACDLRWHQTICAYFTSYQSVELLTFL